MSRRSAMACTSALFLTSASLALAQALPHHTPASSRPASQSAESGVQVRGWRARFDDRAAAADLLFLRRMGIGLHLTTLPAALVWKPGQIATGDYRFNAFFSSQITPTNRGAFGLFVGGSRLEDEGPRYTAFLVRSDGKYRIERRNPSLQVLVDWTGSSALMKPDPQGTLYSRLAIQVIGDAAHFMANSKELSSLPASKLDLNGTVGIRVEDHVDVHIELPGLPDRYDGA
jgi:hypothetical protein